MFQPHDADDVHGMQHGSYDVSWCSAVHAANGHGYGNGHGHGHGYEHE